MEVKESQNLFTMILHRISRLVPRLAPAAKQTTRKHRFSTASSQASSVADSGATKDAKPFNQIPTNWKSTWPIIGAAPVFLSYAEKPFGMRTEDFMYDHYVMGKEHGLCRFGPSNEACVLVFDEGYLEVLKQESKYPVGILEGAWPIEHYNRKYKNGVVNPFMAKGEEWRKGRMAINPHIFNIKTAQTYLGSINNAAANASKQFEQYATEGKLDSFCELAAVDMFMAAALGLELNAVSGDTQGRETAQNLIGPIASMAQIQAQCPWSKIDMLKFSAWDNFVSQWTLGRKTSTDLVKAAMEGGKGSGRGIMHSFLKDVKGISKEETTEMLLILTLAAGDTTSALVNNVINNLSKNPEVQGLVREEMERELGGKDYHGDAKLPYLDQVLKETQRLTPSLPWVNVKFKIPDPLVINGFEIPAGTTLVFSHMGMKHDETYAGADPLQFKPERFSKEAIASRKGTKAEFLDHPIACKPFGYGARMCVGSRIAKLEYSSILSRIIQDHTFEQDYEASQPTIRLSKTTTVEYPSPVMKVAKL